MASVGFCVVATTKRGYPPEEATHMALSKTCRYTHTHTDFYKRGTGYTAWGKKITLMAFYRVIYHITFFGEAPLNDNRL